MEDSTCRLAVTAQEIELQNPGGEVHYRVPSTEYPVPRSEYSVSVKKL